MSAHPPLSDEILVIEVEVLIASFRSNGSSDFEQATVYRCSIHLFHHARAVSAQPDNNPTFFRSRTHPLKSVGEEQMLHDVRELARATHWHLAQQIGKGPRVGQSPLSLRCG